MKSEAAGESSTIVKEVIINAPLSKVWKAITEPGQIEKWLMPPENFKLEEGNEFTMTGRNKEKTVIPHFCKIIEIIPEKKLSYTWAVEDMLSETLVTYELEEQDGNTKLTLSHSGWDKVTLIKPGATRNDYNGGWASVLPGLKNYVENN
jgi:uncharacterized protein YndB with AHSA1/START domain